MPELNSSPRRAGPVRHPGLIAIWLVLVTAYLISSALGQRAVATATVSLMTGGLLAVSGRLFAGLATGLALAALCWYFSSSMQFLVYAPPLMAFAFMASFFHRTLRPGSVALITQVARKEHPELPADLERYTRLLTWIWAMTFLSLFGAALLLAPLLAVDTWSRIVHGLGYLIPATLFLGEYAFRHYRFPDRAHGSLWVLIPNIVRVSQEIAMSHHQRNSDPGR